MAKHVPIEYREFYDIPRMFVVPFAGMRFLFDGSFDSELDDYPADYKVYELPPNADVPHEGSWAELPRQGRRVRSIPTAQVRFDPTRRESIESDVLERVVEAARRRVA